MKRTRVAVSLAVVGAVLAVVAFVPLPHHVDCAFEVQATGARSVYAGTAGRIVKTVEAGQQVEEGDILAVLENPDLQIKLTSLQGEEVAAEVRLQNIRYRRTPAASAQLESQVEMLQSLVKLRQKVQEELQRLTIRAPRAGVVLPPPHKEARDAGDGRLPVWSGSPLEPRNRGALLMPDELLCQIGSPDAFEAVLFVDQGDVQLVREGMEVDLKLDANRLQTTDGTIRELSQIERKYVSSGMASQTGGDLQTEIDPETGQVKPRSVSYQARVPLSVDEIAVRPGYRGSAKVHTEPKSLGWRLWRLVTKTFNFEL